jgi:lantibiotic modifying enzyme
MDTVTIPFSRQQRITNSLLLNASFIENIGLLNGKMGIAIYFFRLARETCNSVYEGYAGELIDEIYEEVHAKTPCDFENGLAGIGWGIEYLIRNKYIDADPNEVLEEFDSQIIHEITFLATDDVGILKGLSGYLIYFISRLQSNIPGSKTYDIINKALKETLNKLQEQIEEHFSDFVSDDIWKEPEMFTLTWKYANVLWVLAELIDIRLFSAQSEHLIKIMLCPTGNYHVQPKLYSHRLMVAFVLEKIKRFRSENISIDFPDSLNDMINERTTHEKISIELVQNSAFLINGTMGISLINEWLFKTTNILHFKNESEYWKVFGFEIPETDQGYAGFSVESEKLDFAFGLLNGITGVGLNYLLI